MSRGIKYLTGETNERRTTSFKRHERGVRKALGGVETVGSGNKGMKGDVWAGDRDAGQRLMVECKATEKRSISVKLDWLEKLVQEAHEAGREPVLAIRFEAMKFAGAKDWAAVPMHRLQELLELEARVRKNGEGLVS